jgi:hypothetical protein
MYIIVYIRILFLVLGLLDACSALLIGPSPLLIVRHVPVSQRSMRVWSVRVDNIDDVPSPHVSVPDPSINPVQRYHSTTKDHWLSHKATLLCNNAKAAKQQHRLVPTQPITKASKSLDSAMNPVPPVLTPSELKGLMQEIMDSDNRTTTWEHSSITNAVYGLGALDTPAQPKTRLGSAETRLTCFDPTVRKFVSYLSAKVSGSKPSGNFGVMAVSKMLFGMRKLSSACDEVEELVSAVTSQLSSSEELLDAQAVGNMLFGLQNMSPAHKEVRSLMGVLANKIQELVTISDSKLYQRMCMKGQEIGNALYGLKNMDSRFEVVLQLVTALTRLIVFSSANYNHVSGSTGKRPNSEGIIMKPCELANAFYGLQHMTSDNYVVLRLLSALIPIIENSSKHSKESLKFTAQEIGSLFYGLQGMSGDDVEVRLVLRTLLPHLQAGFTLDPQGAANVLYGLQKMSSDHAVIREILALVAPLIATIPVIPVASVTTADIQAVKGSTVTEVSAHKSARPFTAQEISNALLGLSGMSSDYAEVQQVLKILRPHIVACGDQFDAQELSCAVRGLQNMTCYATGQTCDNDSAPASQNVEDTSRRILPDILGALSCRLGGLFSGNVISTRSRSNVLSAHEICNCLRGLSRMMRDIESVSSSRLSTASSLNTNTVRAVLAALIPHVRTCPTVLARDEEFCEVVKQVNRTRFPRFFAAVDEQQGHS